MSRNFTDWWLSNWTSTSQNRTELTANKSTGHMQTASMDHDNLIVYALLFVSNTLFNLARAFLFSYSCMIAGKNIHNGLAESLFRVSVHHGSMKQIIRDYCIIMRGSMGMGVPSYNRLIAIKIFLSLCYHIE